MEPSVFATMVDALVVCDFVIIVMEDFLKCECDVTSRQPTISRAKPKTNHSVHFSLLKVVASQHHTDHRLLPFAESQSLKTTTYRTHDNEQ
jgi:hypothetical protein